MIDLFKRVENDVKQSIVEGCRQMGLNKDDAGFLIGGGGVTAPQMVRDPQTGDQGIAGFAPTWVITVSLRSTLVGYEPIAGSLPIYDVLPSADAIKAVVLRLLHDVNEVRDQQSGVTPPKPVTSSSLIIPGR